MPNWSAYLPVTLNHVIWVANSRDTDPAETSDEQILERLLAVNQQRAVRRRWQGVRVSLVAHTRGGRPKGRPPLVLVTVYRSTFVRSLCPPAAHLPRPRALNPAGRCALLIVLCVNATPSRACADARPGLYGTIATVHRRSGRTAHRGGGRGANLSPGDGSIGALPWSGTGPRGAAYGDGSSSRSGGTIVATFA